MQHSHANEMSRMMFRVSSGQMLGRTNAPQATAPTALSHQSLFLAHPLITTTHKFKEEKKKRKMKKRRPKESGSGSESYSSSSESDGEGNRRSKRKKNRCWKGYKPAKGKKPYSEGSCVKA